MDALLEAGVSPFSGPVSARNVENYVDRQTDAPKSGSTSKSVFKNLWLVRLSPAAAVKPSPLPLPDGPLPALPALPAGGHRCHGLALAADHGRLDVLLSAPAASPEEAGLPPAVQAIPAWRLVPRETNP